MVFGPAEASRVRALHGRGFMGRIDDQVVFEASETGMEPAEHWSPVEEPPLAPDLYTFLNRRKPGDIILCSWGTPRIYGYFSHGFMALEEGLLVDVRGDPNWGEGVFLATPEYLVERITRAYAQLVALEVVTAGEEVRSTAVDSALERVGLPFSFLVPRTSDQAYYCTQFVWQMYFLASGGAIDLGLEGSYFIIPDHIYRNPNTVAVEAWKRDDSAAD